MNCPGRARCRAVGIGLDVQDHPLVALRGIVGEDRAHLAVRVGETLLEAVARRETSRNSVMAKAPCLIQRIKSNPARAGVPAIGNRFRRLMAAPQGARSPSRLIRPKTLFTVNQMVIRNHRMPKMIRKRDPDQDDATPRR